MTESAEVIPPAPLTHDAGTPSELALRMGYAGLVPFVGGALVIWLLAGRDNLTEPLLFAVRGLATYAALVAAFVGGLPWGLSMRRPHDELSSRALWSGTVYALGAWIGVCMPPHSGLVVLGALLIACYLRDRKLYPALGVAPWLQWRFRLTAVASFSCFLAAAQI